MAGRIERGKPVAAIDGECFIKRTFCLGYDNGITPGSSSNDCGSRANLVRFSWAFEVVGWDVNFGSVGEGDALGPYPGWTPQLQGWAGFFNASDPNPNSDAAFGFLPAPTWRYTKITGCDPEACYGKLTIQRDDGCIFTVYPLFAEASYDHVYECKDSKGAFTYFREDGEGKRVEIDKPDDWDCYRPKSYAWKPFIKDGAESPCQTRVIENLCDTGPDPDVNIVAVIDDCDGRRTTTYHTLRDWIGSESPEIPEYDPTGDIAVIGDDGSKRPFTPPSPPCTDFVVTELWTIENKTPGLYNREWGDLGPASPFTNDPSGPEAYIDAFDDAQPPTTDTIVTANTFALNDTDNTAGRLDYQKRWGRVCIEKPQTIEFGTNSEGYIAFWVGLCGQPMQRVISYAKGVGLERTPRHTLPPGIHDIRLDNLDWGGSNSNWTLYRVDGEATTADNGLFDAMTSTTLPYERCKKVKVCKDTDALVDLLTGDVLDRTQCRACALPPCPAASSSGGGSDGSGTTFTRELTMDEVE